MGSDHDRVSHRKAIGWTGLILFLAGCATSNAISRGPSGRPMFHIEGVGATSAYEKAAARCPAGYDILHSRQQGLFFVIDIECR